MNFHTIIITVLLLPMLACTSSNEDIPSHVLQLIQPEIETGMCSVKCSGLLNTDAEACMGMCLEPELCRYNWLCTSLGCVQGCAPPVQHKPWWFITNIQQTPVGIQWDISDRAETATILLGQDRDGMWSLIAGSGAYKNYDLTSDEVERYDSIAVVLISTTGVQDTKVISLNKEFLTTTTTKVNIVPKDISPGASSITRSVTNSQDLVMFVTALITTVITITALILLICIIRTKKHARKVEPVPTVKLSPIMTDYSQTPSTLV